MAENKSIEFRAKIDMSEFDQQIQSINQRMRGIDALKTAGQQGSTSFGQAAQRVYQRESSQTLGTLKQEFNTRELFRRNQEKQLKTIDKQLKDINKSEADRTKLLKERESLESRITKSMKEQLDLSSKARQLDPQLQGFRGAAQQPMGGGQAGPGMNLDTDSVRNYRQFRGMGFGRGMSRMFTGIGGPAAVLAGAGAVGIAGARLGSSIFSQVAEQQRNIRMAQGSAVQSATTPLQEQVQGRGLETAAFSKERDRAYRTVEKEFDSRRTRDIIGAVTRILGTGVAGAAAGGGYGAIAGGGPLSLPGAVGGATLGGIGGLIGGTVNEITNKQTRLAVTGTPEYYANLSKEALQKAEALTESNKQINFDKMAAFRTLQKNRQFYKGFGRRFGEANPTDEGGLLRAGMDQGLTGQTTFGIANQMMQTAGITKGAENIEDIKKSYLLQQGGLTNAPKIMGAIQGLGRGMGEQTTDQSMKRLFSEAFKSGIIDSGMVEEIRTFSEASVNLAMKTGIKVEEAASLLSQGVSGKFTTRGLQGANSALGLQSQQGTAGGVNLQRKLAFANTEEGRSLLGGAGDDLFEMYSLLSMDPTKMTENDPIVQRLMDDMGVDFSELKKRKKEIDIRGALPDAKSVQMFDTLQRGLKGLTPKESGKSIRKGGKNFQAYTNLAIRLKGVTSGTKELDSIGLESYITGVARTRSGDQGFDPSSIPLGIRSPSLGMTAEEEGGGFGGMLAKGRRSRETTFEKNLAANEAASIERLARHIDEFAKQAEKHSKTAIAVDDAMQSVVQALLSGTIGIEAATKVRNALREVREGGRDLGSVLKEFEDSAQPNTSANTGSVNHRLSGSR